MSFKSKHPYLFWQLIGLGFLAAAAAYMLLHLNGFRHDYRFLIFVMLVFTGTSCLTLSPLSVWLRRRDRGERQRNRWILTLQGLRHGRFELLLLGGMLLVTFAALAFLLQRGLFFLLPAAIYVGVIPYLIFWHVIKKRFYRVPQAERFCSVRAIVSPEELETPESMPTLLYENIEPDESFLRYIYNYFVGGELLRKREIEIVRVPYGVLNRRYGFHFANEADAVLCITDEQIKVKRDIMQNFADEVNPYGDRIAFLAQLTELATAQNLFQSGADQEAMSVCGKDGLTDRLIVELESLKNTAESLGARMRKGRLSAQTARDRLLSDYPYLSAEEASRILAAVEPR